MEGASVVLMVSVENTVSHTEVGGDISEHEAADTYVGGRVIEFYSPLLGLATAFGKDTPYL